MKREPVASERDTWLRRLMRPTSEPDTTSACLDAETLAAWADGVLRGKQLAAAELHVSQCSRCLALLAAIERTAPASFAEIPRRGSLVRWLVPLAAVATAVAIWIAIPKQPVAPVSREAAPEAAPIAAAPEPAPIVPRPPEEVIQPKVLPQLAPSARVVDEAAQAPAPTHPPAAAAPATTAVADSTAATVQRTLEAKAIEAVGADPLVRWRIVSGTDVERSIDGGQTWVRTASPQAEVVAIRDVDERRATLTTSDGRTLSTTDGGATWAPVALDKLGAP